MPLVRGGTLLRLHSGCGPRVIDVRSERRLAVVKSAVWLGHDRVLGLYMTMRFQVLTWKFRHVPGRLLTQPLSGSRSREDHTTITPKVWGLESRV